MTQDVMTNPFRRRQADRCSVFMPNQFVQSFILRKTEDKRGKIEQSLWVQEIKLQQIYQIINYRAQFSKIKVILSDHSFDCICLFLHL
jgi:hypothetical protein